MELYDISLTLSENLPTWPGDPTIKLNKISRIQDGEMFDRRHHEMLPLLAVGQRHSLQGKVVGFGSAGSEIDLGRLGIDERSDPGPGSFQGLSRRLAEGVQVLGIAEPLT